MHIVDERQRVFFCTTLDSTHQAEMVPGDPAGWSGHRVARDGIAALRLALLVGDRLAVTHAQLLDGRLFLALGPRGFAQAIAYEHRTVLEGLPLRVTIRGRSLADALIGLVRPHDEESQTLRPFEFSSLPPMDRDRVANGLTAINVADFDTWVDRSGPSAAMACALLQAGLTADWCAAYEARWQQWLDAEQQLQLIEAAFTGIRPEDADDDMAERGMRRLARIRAGENAEHALAELVRRMRSRAVHESRASDGAIRSRSTARRVIRERCASLPAIEIEALMEWVDDVYRVAQARQAGARLLDIAESRGDEPSEQGEPGGRLVLCLTDSLKEELVAMPPEVYGTARYRIRDAIAIFREADLRTRRRMILDAPSRAMLTISWTLSQALEQPDPRRQWRNVLAKVTITIVTAVLLALELATGWKVVLAISFTTFALFPELLALANTRRRRLQRVLAVRRAA